MTDAIDDIFAKVTSILDHGLLQEEQKIKEILQTSDDKEISIFKQCQQSNSLKKHLILGFCFKLGVGTTANYEKAFEIWKKDNTTYGKYMVGLCYFFFLNGRQSV